MCYVAVGVKPAVKIQMLVVSYGDEILDTLRKLGRSMQLSSLFLLIILFVSIEARGQNVDSLRRNIDFLIDEIECSGVNDLVHRTDLSGEQVSDSDRNKISRILNFFGTLYDDLNPELDLYVSTQEETYLIHNDYAIEFLGPNAPYFVQRFFDTSEYKKCFISTPGSSEKFPTAIMPFEIDGKVMTYVFYRSM